MIREVFLFGRIALRSLNGGPTTDQSTFDQLRKEAEQLALAGEWGPTAVKANSRLTEIDDHFAAAYTRLARCFLEQGRLGAARELYAQVLQFDPNNRIARNRLAKLKSTLRKGDTVDLEAVAAISTFEEAFSVGVAAGKQKHYNLAVAALNRAVEICRDNRSAWTALGAAYRRKGDLVSAQNAYHQALSLGFHEAPATGLAAVYKDLEDYGRTERLYLDALNWASDPSYALNGLGSVYVAQGRYDEAEDCFRGALEYPRLREDAMDKLLLIRAHYQTLGETASAERISGWLVRFSRTDKAR